MTSHRAAGAHRAIGSHRAPRVRPRGRRGWLAAALVVLLAVTGFAAWRAYFHEGPPDVAAAGPGSWVSTHGSDSADGGPGTPWRSVQHAIDTVPAGTKIFLREGEYAPFSVTKAGVTVTSAPGERATITGRSGTRDVVLVAATGVTIADLTVRGCVPKPNADVNVTGDHGSGIRVHRVSRVTVSGVTVRDSHGKNSQGLPVGCYGVLVTESRDVHVTGSEITANGAGVVVSRGGRGVLVDNNDIHGQDVIIQNTAVDDDDFGGYGMAATFIDDTPGPVFRNNTVRDNHGQSSDYGRDGGGMEIYDAHDVTITGNTFENNDGLMETGTGRSGTCSNIVFTGNRALGGNERDGFDGNTGLLLRCSTGMVISGNTFTNLQKFTFLLATGNDFAGQINNMRITGNTIQRRSTAAVWRLQYEAGQPTGVQVDKNTYRSPRTGFAIMDGVISERAATFDEWRTRTGWDKTSTIK